MEYIPAKTIVSKVKYGSSWFGVDYNMNIYRGCSHGCIYCDSRSLCYQNVDFDQVKAKENALQKMREELRRKVKSGVIGTGAMSDPYNPFEKKELLTRHALALMDAFDFGVAIATKSALVTRDIDILEDIKAHSPVLVKITVTTADEELCKKIEPHVSSVSKRFRAINALAERGIICGVLMMPILPYINDNENNIRRIVQEAKAAGADFVYPAMGMTLREGNREYFYKKLEESFPGIKEKYIKRFGLRYNCTSSQAKRLWESFKEECEKQGMIHDMKSIINRYKRGYGEQLSLFHNVDGGDSFIL
ncbi:MAG: radical SAM protein [Lachnospiraceae bacterium]|nr:radical SAM protein [Lachnospiraceae bacterium]